MNPHELNGARTPNQGMTASEIKAEVRKMTKGRHSLVEDVGRSSLGPTGEMTELQNDFLIQVVRRGLDQEVDPANN